MDDVVDADPDADSIVPPEDLDLAAGSDVHDVDDLSRQLDADELATMLRAYLDEEPE